MTIELNIVMRDDLGKGASRRLRHAGKLPAIIYGEGKDPVSITLEQKDVQYVLPNEALYSQIISLNMDGKKENVLLRDIQYHPFKIDVMHLDFLRFDATHVVNVHVPLHFLGEEESPAVKTEDGVFNHVLMEVEVECLPKDIPSFIDVDLSGLHVNDVVHLSDLKLPEGVELLALKHGEEYDTAVASVHVRRVSAATEEEEEGEAPAAPSEDEEGS
jgi:large subunit ribosomal protein L25